MEAEINLRPYINALIRNWYWIAGLALAAAVVAFGVSSLLPTTYQATAMVAITKPTYLLQFDPRVENIPFDPTQLARGYPAIATSDELLLSIANSSDPPLPSGQRSPEQLREVLAAQSASDPTLINLTAKSDDPEQAARLANLWAARFIDHLNAVYSGNGHLTLFETQVAEAKTALEQADQALAAFRSQYGLGFGGFSDSTDGLEPVISELGLTRQLQAKTDLLTEYEMRANQTAQLLSETRSLATQVDDTTSPAILAGLLADMMRLGLLDGQGDSPSILFDFGDADVNASLAALTAALEAKQRSTDETIARLTDEVAVLQIELATRQGEIDQLLRDRQVAQSTYLTLSNKLQETRLEAQNESQTMARLLSRASAPQKPVSPRRLRNTLAAGALGLMVGVFGALFLGYWRGEEAAKALPAGELSPEQLSAR